MDTSSIKKTMAQDTALYLPAKIIEGVLGLLLLYACTNYFFMPEVYSHITYGTGLINIMIGICLSYNQNNTSKIDRQKHQKI